ncbi:MAG: single-stranded-DNA-specific exonuclease RecJ [Bdellovibrionales bacterium]
MAQGLPSSEATGQSDDRAFLGVARSFTGRRWVARASDERLALALAQRHALPDILARSLASRGIGLGDAEAFLAPKLREVLPDPYRLKDMEAAALRMVVAVMGAERVAVFGDYDVDGATSSALLMRFSQAVGCSLRLYVPDRLREGYGPNAPAMRQLAEEGIKLVVCVDCGATAHEALAAAKEAGLDVIVLDHHATEAALPPAFALVNPNRIDEDGAYGNLAAVGVTYLFVIAVNRALREAGWYGVSRREPDLLGLLDLVALGTVCDVVKLTGLNRAFVTQGLRVMAKRGNAGIAALAAVAGCRPVLDAFSAGFQLGPRVNAGGRVGEADLGAKLLFTQDASVAQTLAQHLHALNEERRMIEAQILADADEMVFLEDSPMVFASSERWHPGVIGIVASRLKDKYHRPAIVVALQGEIGKGSGRSVSGVDLGAHVLAARQAGLLVNGGGHAMAAGLTVERGKLGALQEFLAGRIGRQIEAAPLVPSLALDGLATAGGLHVEFLEQMACLAPFGAGNPEPRFALAGCRVVRANVVGEKHVSVIVSQGGASLRGIAFRAMDSDLGLALLSLKGRPCHLAGHARLDEWQGQRRAQIHIDDAAEG